jgi:hypothetical protein
MKTVSTIPAVIDAIVALAQSVFSTTDVQVLDGGPVKSTDPNVVAIGFTGIQGEVAVESTRTRQQLTTDPDRESYEITCLASSWLGHEADPKEPRDYAYGIVNALAEALAENSRLGGLVMRANIRTEAFAPEQTSEGAVATVRFVIGVDAYTR